MSSITLFHGPRGRDQAVQQASLIGVLVGEPIGDKGLKVDDSRKIVLMSQQGSVGDKPPVVIVGPLDKATPEASDALLKTLEDLAEGQLRILLWADHLTGVVGTIRSRVLLEWCPPTSPSGYSNLHSHLKTSAQKLCRAALTQNLFAVLTILDENSEDYEALLDAVADSLSEMESSPDTYWLWENVRRALGARWLGSKTSVACIFMKDSV